MESILNKSTERQKKLILYIARNYKWVTAQELADYLECNIKTVRQDIIDLEEEYSDILSIEYSKQQGYRFHTIDGRNILEIYLKWIQESLFFSILSDCFFEKNDCIDYFYNTYFISETTLKRQLSLINRTLKKIGISISVSTGKMKVKDEKLLRFFYSLFSLEKRSIYEWTDINMDQEVLFSIIERCESYFDLSLNIVQKNIFSFFIYISVTRSSQDNFIQSPMTVPESFYKQLKEPLQLLRKEDSLDVFLTTNAQYMDSLQFIYDIFSHLAEHYHSETVHSLTKTFIQLITTKMQVEDSVLDFEGIKKELAYVTFMNEEYPHPMSLVSLRSELNASSIQARYPVFYDSVSDSIEVLSKDVSWLIYYKHLLISRVFRYWDYRSFEQLSKIKPVSIAISTTLEENHADVLAYMLKQTFQSKVDIVFKEYDKTLFNSENNKKELEGIEIVITNHMFYRQLDNNIIVDDVIETYRLEGIKQTINSLLMKHTRQKSIE
ncbi:helix-turn-helix domain-containing protein [Vagococcus sp. JNUCC 83]